LVGLLVVPVLCRSVVDPGRRSTSSLPLPWGVVARPSGDSAAADAVVLLDEVVAAVQAALGQVDDWGLAGTRSGQHHSDLAADAAAVEVLTRAGVAVLSEESGLRAVEHPLLVVVDPLDGSTNASRDVSWWAISLCAVADGVPVASVVADVPGGARFEATAGGGARRDGRPILPSGATELGRSLIGVNGLPAAHLGWDQFRALGAAALDLCAVACGALDGYVDCTVSSHGPWDYLGALLVCTEAGAAVADAEGRDLVVLDHAARRTPVAAATPALLAQLLAARSASLPAVRPEG
jgi:myo-inositol-1(or 4)-monophosphatase